MATLVLSTVGNAIGGPVGGAIGALIGQSLDRQLLGPASRGPRLGDLNVQTSSYGTQIPRIYGAMRVAGSVIWATDIVESENVDGGKGQPDVGYSYSVSLAVALSSRPLISVGRVWADGKLLRGVEGDFKTPTNFRFYDGSEAQEADPLIASVEGIGDTPAFRGLALAVFEELELAEYGNRIPFLTFEVFGDAGPTAIGSVLSDASAGAIVSNAATTIVGFAAYGSSVATALEPLIDSFDVALFDDGARLRSPVAAPAIAIASGELGSSADASQAPRIEREHTPVSTVPATLRLSYYDPARDYQSGEARALAGEPATNEVHRELPAVLEAGQAKSLAQQILARQWADRDRLTLRLPPSRLGLEPGAVVQPDHAAGAWEVSRCTLEGFAVVAEMRPLRRSGVTLAGDSGRIAINPDIVQAPSSLLLLDVLNPFAPAATEPVLLVATSAPNAGWSARNLVVSSPGQTVALQTSGRKSVIGRTLSVLAHAEPFLVDESNSVDVELVDRDQWLTSCDPAALGDGINLALIGREVLQFGSATWLSPGRFRLSGLLRARGGTEWATGAHAVDERFCLLEPTSLRPVPLPLGSRGAVITVSDRYGASASTTFEGEALRPLTPVDVAATVDASGLSITWLSRSRSGFTWVDEIDAPLGEAREEYRVTIRNGDVALDFTSAKPALTLAAADLAAFAGGTVIVEVRQLGDGAASRPAQTTVELS